MIPSSVIDCIVTDNLETFKKSVEGTRYNPTSGKLPADLMDEIGSLLHTAAFFGATRIISYLVKDNKVSTELRNKTGSTALITAAWAKQDKSIKVLLQLGADPNAFNQYGSTALMYGVGSSEVTRELLKGGASKTAANSYRWLAIDWAKASRNPESVELLSNN